MKTIFAPWRMEFILGRRERGCIFCNRIKRRRDRADLIIHRGRWNLVILNKYPYNNGHLMVVPYRHIALLKGLKPDEATEMFSLVQRSETCLDRALKAQGFNVGMNIGKAAGAGIEDHIHFHVVPRWMADTNFWPVIAETKSMPEHLMKTYDRLKKTWEEL